MIFLISQRESKDVHGCDIDVLEASYSRYFTKMNINLIPVSNYMDDKELSRYLNLIEYDGIILTGGGDVPLNMYDSPIKNHHAQINRDILEYKLIEIALKNNKKIIGICRGFQFINGYLGGRTSALKDINNCYTIGVEHIITLKDREVSINHFHNDVVLKNDLASKLQPIGIDNYLNSVEVAYSNELRIIAFQFHPERTISNVNTSQFISEILYSFIYDGGK